MNYGSMFGDGAGRGPDFTADALHRTSTAMEAYYLEQHRLDNPSQFQLDAIRAQVQREIKTNTYNSEGEYIQLTAGQVVAFHKLNTHYGDFLRKETSKLLPTLAKLTDEEITDITAFFFWDGWVCGAERPGREYSYTNNWPYDKDAGNTPPSTVVFWSIMAIFGLFLTLGIVLFLHGRFSELVGWRSRTEQGPVTPTTVNNFAPKPMQRATYKFFLAAALLFVIQVGAGVLTAHNFLGLQVLFGIDVGEIISLAASRGWHLQLALLWVTACWVGVSFFLLEQSYKQSKSQLNLVNLLFCLFVIMVSETAATEPLAPEAA